MDLFAAHRLALAETVHPLTFRAPSAESWVDAVEAYHPAWRAARRVLDETAWTDLRAASIAELSAANEDPDAFAVTSTYRVLRADLPA